MTTPTPSSDLAEAEGTILEMLQAAARRDVAAVVDCVSEDLLLYKVGRIRRRSDLLDAVREFTSRGGRAEYTLHDVTTRLDGKLCVVNFRSEATIEIPGEPVRHPRWLESAVLEYTDRWRIVFYHSTDELEPGQ